MVRRYLPAAAMLLVLGILTGAGEEKSDPGSLRAAGKAKGKSGLFVAPMLSPSGLDADAANDKVMLEWNPNTEAEVTGYDVYRWAPGAPEKKAQLNAAPVKETWYADTTAAAGTVYNYAVTAVFAGGQTRESLPVSVTTLKDKAADAKVTDSDLTVNTPEGTLKVGGLLAIEFANGHSLMFDRGALKWRDWKTPDKQHMVSSRIYGNAMDFGSYDNFGFTTTQPATDKGPVAPAHFNFNTAPGQEGRQAGKWIGHSVDGQRVTLSYRIPLVGPGLSPDTKGDLWLWARVNETWFPVDRKIGGTSYSGLARRIEIVMPSYFQKEGFSLELNDAFGFDGSCEGITTYRSHSWAGPAMDTTTFKRGELVTERGKMRKGGNFHPTETALQTHPFVFMDHAKGTLIISPRRQYYCTTFTCSNYADQKQDGVFPNFQIDLAGAGGPLAVDTFEYLYSPDRESKTPQRYLDARFHYYRRMARLYDLPPYLTAATCDTTLYWSGEDKAAESAVSKARECEEAGADLFIFYHPLWFSAGHAMDLDTVTNLDNPQNKIMAKMAAAFNAKGVKMCYWMRPDFVMAPRAAIASDAFWTPYYGYSNQTVPALIPLIEKRGLPLVREHPEWMRKGHDGTYPGPTNYNWTPMSMSGPWLDEMVWSVLKTSGQLGAKTVFFDGGYGGMNGVDYTSGAAVPAQPYWWRLFRLTKEAGLDVYGECSTSFGGSCDLGPVGDISDYPWWFANVICNPTYKDPSKSAETRHKVHQVYGAVDMGHNPTAEDRLATKFFRAFVAKNGPPERVVFKGLRQEGAKWAYDGVDWEYEGGKRVEYPNSYK